MTAPTSGFRERVVVDPRFRERRIAVRKEAGRRRLKRLLLLIAVALVALTAVIVLKSPMLDVDEIVVDGAVNTDAATIAEVAGIERGAPLLLADLDGARAAIEGLPWVRSATVTRELPNGVRVEVVERTAVAMVAAAGTMVVVDETGTVVSTSAPAGAVFPPYIAVISDLPAPAAGQRVDAGLITAIELAGRLRENPPSAVAAIRLEPTVRLELTAGGQVEFGDLSQIDDKVEAFRTMWARVDRSCLDTIDLRVPTHPVLTRSDPCS